MRCDAISLDKFSIDRAAQYDVVIFGGGIHAGRVNGIKFIKNNMPLLAEKTVVVFATGATAPIPEEIEKFETDNIPDEMKIKFFYFQSGMNYSRIHGTDRLLMGVLKTVLTVKKNKSDVEKGTLDAIQESYDYSDRSQIEPLTRYIKQGLV